MEPDPEEDYPFDLEDSGDDLFHDENGEYHGQ